jgi:hypothetical protein
MKRCGLSLIALKVTTMSNQVRIHFYCEHTTDNHFDCNRALSICDIAPNETLKDAIEDTEWGYTDGDVRCPEHL